MAANTAIFKKIRSDVRSLISARTVLRQEILNRHPAYASLVNPAPITLDRVQQSLTAGEALIATYVGEKATYVWAVPKAGNVVFAVAPLSERRIAAAVTNLRHALDPKIATLGEIPEFDIAASHDLYKALLAPVERGWKGSKSLLVIADGPLGQLPFSVLVTSPESFKPAKPPLFSKYRYVPFLARTHAVTVLPSVATFVTLRALPPSNMERRSFAGFGDPLFSQAHALAPNEKPKEETKTAALTSRSLISVRGLTVHLRSAPKLDGVSSADLAKLPPSRHSR